MNRKDMSPQPQPQPPSSSSSSAAFQDYWNELHETTKQSIEYSDDLTRQYEDGEEEAEWLCNVGLDHLVENFKEGREITEKEMNSSLKSLVKPEHAEAVKRRILSLNDTIKKNSMFTHHKLNRTKNRKPNVKDVFNKQQQQQQDSQQPQTESSMTSEATDLLDSIAIREKFCRKKDRKDLPASSSSSYKMSAYSELFRKPNNWDNGIDIATNISDGIELLAYQRFGTINRSFYAKGRSESDPSLCSLSKNRSSLWNDYDDDEDDEDDDGDDGDDGENDADDEDERGEEKGGGSDYNVAAADEDAKHQCNRRTRQQVHMNYKNKKNSLSHESVSIHSNEQHLSFEEMFKIADKKKINSFNVINNVHVDYLSDYEICHLRPLLWLELSILFDKYSIEFRKRKPCRRKQKNYGNVFGVSLSTLVMRDRRISNDSSTIPQIVQILISELMRRCLSDEGLLRVACQRQKVEQLFDKIEQHFYTNPGHVKLLLQQAKSHELTAILKKLFKDLPEPIIPRDLINLFYNVHHIPNETELLTALNYLVLLLPLEHRNTLLIFMNFLSNVIKNEESNKMSVHNVAMIVAPTVFPPRYLFNSDVMDLNIQISIAATSCHIVEQLITYADCLWHIPSDLFLSMNQKIKNNVKKKNCS